MHCQSPILNAKRFKFTKIECLSSLFSYFYPFPDYALAVQSSQNFSYPEIKLVVRNLSRLMSAYSSRLKL
jgi:hypothetical protein